MTSRDQQRVVVTVVGEMRPNSLTSKRAADDNVVDIRAKSRLDPQLHTGQFGLSLSKGVVFSQNTARRTLEQLRQSLQWDSAPVITHFDPRYNQHESLWFEKLYDAFKLSHT